MNLTWYTTGLVVYGITEYEDSFSFCSYQSNNNNNNEQLIVRLRSGPGPARRKCQGPSPHRGRLPCVPASSPLTSFYTYSQRSLAITMFQFGTLGWQGGISWCLDYRLYSLRTMFGLCENAKMNEIVYRNWVVKWKYYFCNKGGKFYFDVLKDYDGFRGKSKGDRCLEDNK